MFFKDVIRLIKSTFNRFLAIAAIVFIGVAFMMGLLANVNIMRDSVDDYDKKNNLHDVQLYSNFGFDDNDVEALKKLDVVLDVYASKTRDVYGTYNSLEPFVFRVRELNSNINTFELTDGRLPSKENECILIDNTANGGLSINDKVSLFLEDEELEESLKNCEYIIVGMAKSPEYMAKMLSSSLLDNLELEHVLLIPNSNFISEYYSSVLLTIQGSNDYNSLKDEYFSFIQDKVERVKDFSNSQQYALKNKIVDEAQKEIADAKEELEKGRKDGQKELDDAYIKLVDAKKEIDDAKKEIADNEALLIDAEDEFNKGYKELIQKEKELNDAIKTVESTSSMSIDNLYETTKTTLNSYNTLKENQQTLETSKQQLIDTKTQIDSLIVSASETINPLTKDNLNVRMNEIDNKESPEYLYLKNLYDALEFLETYEMNIQTIQGNLDIVNNAISQIDNVYSSSGGINETYNNLNMLVEGRKQVIEGHATLNKAKDEIDDGYQKLDEGKAELEKGIKEYYDGLAEYDKGVKDFKKEIAEAEDEIEDAENEIKDLDGAKWIVLDRDSHYSSYMYKSSCNQMNAIGIVMPVIFFLVAALVCSTTMKRLIDEQRGQIGIYCALGYSNFSIIARYLTYVLLATLLSSFIAIFVGIAIFPTVIYNTWRLMYNLPTMKVLIPLGKMVLSISSFALLMCVVSYIVIKNTIKECPAQLMRPKSPKASKEVILERIHFMWNRLSFTSKITARNLFRYKSRFFMTVLGIAGCTGLLVLGFGIKDSISDIVNIQYSDFFNHDYTVNLNDDRHIDDINRYIKEDLDNEYFANYSTYSSKITFKSEKDDIINVICLNSDVCDEIFHLYDYRTNERLSLEDNDVIITEKFAINNNLSIGDEISIESKEGVVAKAKITKISKMYFQHYMFISENCYENIFDEQIEYTNIAVKNKGDTTKLFNLKKEFNDVASVNDFSSFISNFNVMIEALDFIILVIIITSGALAFVVLINLINVNISERTREIATLKVLGFRDREVEAYIFKEIIILTLIGTVLGMPLGVVELKFVMGVIDMEMIKFPTVVKIASFIYAFCITMIFTIIVFLLTKKTLKKIEMVESLKSVE